MDLNLKEYAFYYMNGDTDFKLSYDISKQYEEGFTTLFPTYKDFEKAIKNEYKINVNDVGNFNAYKEEFSQLFSDFSFARKEPLTIEEFPRIRSPRKNWEKILIKIKELAKKAFVSYAYLVEQASSFTEGFAENLSGFSISESLIKNVKVFGSLKNIEAWKSKVLFGSNGGRIGEWDDVGYVGISLDSNSLIPVPRGDEHHAGYEYINGVIRKKLVPKENYIAIWALESGNYFYADYESLEKTNKNAEDLYLAIKKYFSYGGKDSPLKLYGQGLFTDYETTLSSFMKEGGLKTTKKDIPMPTELTSEAEDLINDLRMFANVSLDAIKNERKIMNFGEKILKDLENIIRYDPSSDVAQVLKLPMEEAYDSDSPESMVGNILGLAGVKNRLHTYLKKVLKNKPEKEVIIINALFGSLKTMVKELDALGKI